MLPPPPRSTLFPYTTLFRSNCLCRIVENNPATKISIRVITSPLLINKLNRTVTTNTKLLGQNIVSIMRTDNIGIKFQSEPMVISDNRITINSNHKVTEYVRILFISSKRYLEQ